MNSSSYTHKIEDKNTAPFEWGSLEMTLTGICRAFGGRHNKAKRDILLLTGGRIFKEVSLELTVQGDVEVPGVGAVSFSGVGTSFHNVGCGNNAS